MPPPEQKGYLSDTCAIPEEKGKTHAIPPLRYYLEKVLGDMGGISHWAAKRKPPSFINPKLLQNLATIFFEDMLFTIFVGI